MILVLLVGCTPSVAPEALEDLMVFGLLNYDNARARVQYVDRAEEQFDLYERDLRNGLRVESLTAQDLVESGLSAAVPDGGEVVGVSTTLTFDSSFEDVVRVLTGDMSLVAPNTISYDTTGVEPADRECFLDRSCDALDFTVQREIAGFWGTARQNVQIQFRWVTRSDGVEVFLFRGLAPDAFETDSVIYRTNQHYQFYGMVDGPEGPTKLEAHWVDAEIIGVPIPDALLTDGAVSNMREHRDVIDAFIASGETN